MKLCPKLQLLIAVFVIARSAFAAEDCAECKRVVNEQRSVGVLTKALQDAAGAEFLARCGNAPLRLFKDKLIVEATSNVELDPSWTFQTRTDVAEPKQTSAYGYWFDENYVRAGTVAGLSYQTFPELSGYARLRATGPAGQPFVVKTKQTVPLELEGLADPAQDYHAKDDRQASSEPKLIVWMHNEDLPIRALARVLPEGLRIKTEDLACPLPESKQGDFCAKMQFPFDPSEIDPNEAKRFGNQVKPRGKKPGSDEEIEPKIFKKLTRRHDSLGFAYAVQYENEKGERFPKKFETRYSGNPYFILSLLTESPCPGWKIRKLSMNFHHRFEGMAFSYRMDKEKNELVQGKFIFSSAMEENKEKIYAAYAKGAKINFIGCNTLTGTQINKVKDPIDGHILTDVEPGVGIGDIFTQMTDPENPIGVVSGYDGTCYPILPTATTPRIGKRKVWKNGKKQQP